MKSINQEINQILNKHLSIQKSLKRRIINIRSLAKHIIEDYGLKYSLDAVISAIRRYDLEHLSLLGSKEAEKYFSKMIIQTKDNVARIVLKDRAFKDVCADYLGKRILKANCRILKSKETITLIVAQKDLEQKLSLFKPTDISKTQKDLSEIRLQFPKDISNIKGIFARVASELATRDINIEDVFYGFPDILIYVKEDSLVKAHQALREIKK
ncbi:MAG: hypothetical protein KKH52_04830 [Nanoarchaeota archaeon]|nr:hypothetical protein [Nanoarchaeota archaeon]MBU1623304.1 hypothetical protein [Nanoarchaeota archaeon]MBU1974691.1 hypothetical protein [Nanoarchaeota archaeon]